MIRNDQEMEVTHERIAYFQRLLAQLRVAAKPKEFYAVASGYRAEIQRMQKEILDYLTWHASDAAASKSIEEEFGAELVDA
jgi:hypothetical protein